MIVQQRLEIRTPGRGFVELTGEIQVRLTASGLRTGICHLFLQHTSASLCLVENADPDVRRDLERWAQRAAPDGDPAFQHRAEGPDDMPAHLRNLLFGYEVTVPVSDGVLALGTWQGIYLWEHRQRAQDRGMVVTLIGDR